MRRSILLLLLALAPAGALAGDARVDARFAELSRALKEVKRSADWEDVKKRRDIINELSELDHPGVTKLLMEAFTKDREQVCRIPAMIGIGRRGGYGAQKAMVSAAVRDKNEVYVMCLPLALGRSKDERIGPWLVRNLLPQKKSLELRAAVIQSLGALKTEEAFEPILKMLVGERGDLRVAYECLLALAAIDPERARPTAKEFLEHREWALRAAAVLAVGATGPLDDVLPLHEDSSALVQEAVAEVIRRRKALDEGVPILIRLLETRRLRVMAKARDVLEELTGEKLGLDPEAWKRYWELKRQGKALPKEPEGGTTSVATYYGMHVLSDRVLFVLDISGSMTAGKPKRIETAKEELTKTLDQLNQRAMFNIVAFSGSPVWWKDSEQKVTKANVADAKEFVERLSAGGGTNVYDTFEQALTMNRLVDTIFFLGDGSPSVGRHTEQEEILARIRWMNRFRKVRIHVIGLLRGTVGRFGGRGGQGRARSLSGPRAYDEEEAARFMARLAAENGGTFLKIDK